MPVPRACSHHDRQCMTSQRTPNSLLYSHDVDLQLTRAATSIEVCNNGFFSNDEASAEECRKEQFLHFSSSSFGKRA